MRHKFLTISLLFAALFLPACRSNTTYKFPTQENTFVTRKMEDEDQKLFRSSYTSFATNNALNLYESGEDFAFPILTSYQLALTLLAAAEGDSYVELAKILNTDAPDDYSLSQGFNNLIAPYSSNSNDSLKFGTSIWMVWPILLQSDFQSEVASRLGSDVIRLGSFGLTAQRSVQSWFDRYTLTSMPPHFDRSSPMMSYGALFSSLRVNFVKREVNGNIFWLGFCTNQEGENSKLRIIAWPQEPKFSLPTNTAVEKLLDEESPSSIAQNSILKEIELTLDLAPLFRESGSEKLITGPNDFRNMSVEIVPEGDPIGMPIMLQYTRLQLSISGDNPFAQPITYAIYDQTTELPLIIGKSTP